MNEFGKRCGRCRRIRPSRMYHKPLRGSAAHYKVATYKTGERHLMKWRKICQECWDELEILTEGI